MDKTTAAPQWGLREWDDEDRPTVQRLLEAKLPAEHISTRPGGGGTLFGSSSDRSLAILINGRLGKPLLHIYSWNFGP
jgi:hypothetical protein